MATWQIVAVSVFQFQMLIICNLWTQQTPSKIDHKIQQNVSQADAPVRVGNILPDSGGNIQQQPVSRFPKTPISPLWRKYVTMASLLFPTIGSI